MNHEKNRNIIQFEKEAEDSLFSKIIVSLEEFFLFQNICPIRISRVL